MTKLKRKDIDDSSSFYKVAKVQTNYQSELTPDNAGSNITITKVNGVTKINATGGGGGGTSYTAGEGIDITNNVISNTSIPDVDKEYVDGQISDLSDAIDGKQDIMTAGTGISISDNTITNTAVPDVDKTYVDSGLALKQDVLTAGTGISISNDTITNTAIPDVNKSYVDTALTGKQDKLTAGSNITIVDNVISSTGSGGTTDFDALTNRPSYNGTAMTSTTDIPEVKTAVWDGKSTVSVSATGTATDEVSYITVDGVEKKIAGGGGGSTPTNMVTTDTGQVITGLKVISLADSQSGSHPYPGLVIAGGDKGRQSPSLMLYGKTWQETYQYGIYQMCNNGTSALNTSFELGVLRAKWDGTTLYNDKLITVTRGPNYQTLVRLEGLAQYVTAYNDDCLLPFGIIKKLMPTKTITGDATTTAFTVSHELGKKPSIVQVTKDSDGVVVNDVTIAKTNNSVVVTFQNAPADGETYTVGMLY